MNDLIAEIAARYGVGVAPDAKVTAVPQGVSGLPLPVWVDNKLIYPEWTDRKKTMNSVAVRNARIARADRNRSDALVVARVSELVAAGSTGAQIAADTGLAIGSVYGLVKHLGLKIQRKYGDGSAIVAISEARRKVREATIRDLVAKGATVAEMGAALGIAADRYVRAAVLKVCPGHVFPRRKPGRAAVNLERDQRRRDARAAAVAAQVAARQAQADEIKALLATHSFTQIGEALRLPRNTVAARVARLRKAGLLPPSVPPEDQAHIEATIIAHAHSHTAAAIGAMLGLSKAAIHGRIETLTKAGRIAPRQGRLPKLAGKPRAPKADPLVYRNQRIMALHEEDKSAAQIAAALGITKRAVWGVLRKHGRVSRQLHRRQHEARITDLRALAAKGMAVAEIAAELRISPKTVYSMASRAGVALGRQNPSTKGQVSASVAARRAKVAEMVGAGRTYTEIMAATGFGKNTIWADIRALGLTGQTAYARREVASAVKPELRDAIIKAHRAGCTYREIATVHGVTWWVVGRIVREALGAAEQKGKAA